MRSRFLFFICICLLGFSLQRTGIPKSTLSKKVVKSISIQLKKEFKTKGLKWGSQIFMRVFKKEKKFEVWVKNGEKFKLFKTYSICYYSGGLGTKTKQGDGKSPEGFYFVKPNQLNPYSSYHLAFNIGYPNKYERLKGYTGSALMVHGRCVSIGCYAMGNSNIEEIYTLLQMALENNQPFIRIHIFPFKFTDAQMNSQRIKKSKSYSFWKNLKEGYSAFEKTKVPPNVEVKNGKYVFN